MPLLNLKNQLRSQSGVIENDGDSGSEISNDETHVNKSKGIDIAFLYADVLTYKSN